MAPKKPSIKVSIPKALQLTAKEVADLKKGFQTQVVRVVKARKSPSSATNVINSGSINVINPGINVINSTSQKRRPKKSATKAKTKAKKR
jgi:hypothetical protein